MVGSTLPSFTTLAENLRIALTDKALGDRLDAVAAYRAALPPALRTADSTTLVLDMLQSALICDWAAARPEGSWLTLEELAMGTFLPNTDVAEALLDLAFHATTELSRRRVDGEYHYSLGNGRDGADD
jgi:hypothetical protein